MKSPLTSISMTACHACSSLCLSSSILKTMRCLSGSSSSSDVRAKAASVAHSLRWEEERPHSEEQTGQKHLLHTF